MKRKSLAELVNIAPPPAEYGGIVGPGDARARRVIPMALSEIRVMDRRRTLDPDQVRVIAESMERIGLQSPIIVRLDLADPAGCVLVAGAHRLAAAKELGWLKIDALVVDGEADELALIEIDENLARAELTPLDRALFLAERREIFNRGGSRRGQPRGIGNSEVANTAPVSFAEEARGLTGLSRRGVFRSLEIASGLDPELVDALQGTPLAEREGDLHRLARLPAAEQRAALQRIREADTAPGRLADIIDSAGRKKAGAVRDALVRAWDRCSEEDHQWFLERLRAAGEVR